jgi:hypothetical protein
VRRGRGEGAFASTIIDVQDAPAFDLEAVLERFNRMWGK